MKFTVLARYGAMRTIGSFSTDIKNLRHGDRCIVRSNRGTEWGEVLSPPERNEERGPRGNRDGMILRRVTPADHKHRRHLESIEQEKEFPFCAQKIKEHGLPMRLASVEHIFGGEKIIFYFLADGRVDFRQLVKDLAAEYRTRIELRQIGVRDEARLLAEYEHCGRELCCRRFIKDLEPVTMRMAKLQKTTLDPTKISGRCGRLMCCLRYEDDTYQDFKRQLPKKGTRVKTPNGIGEVVSSEILARMVLVELPGRRHAKFPVDELEPVTGDEPTPPEPKERTRASEGRERPAGRSRRRGGRSRRPRNTDDRDPAKSRAKQRTADGHAQPAPPTAPHDGKQGPPSCRDGGSGGPNPAASGTDAARTAEPAKSTGHSGQRGDQRRPRSRGRSRGKRRSGPRPTDDGRGRQDEPRGRSEAPDQDGGKTRPGQNSPAPPPEPQPPEQSTEPKKPPAKKPESTNDWRPEEWWEES